MFNIINPITIIQLDQKQEKNMAIRAHAIFYVSEFVYFIEEI
jgi:hypothetical protein